MIHTLIGRLTGWEKKYREALAQRDENKAMATGHLEQVVDSRQRLEALEVAYTQARTELEETHSDLENSQKRVGNLEDLLRDTLADNRRRGQNVWQQAKRSRQAVDLITRAQQQMGLNDSGIPTARKYLADAKTLLGGEPYGAQ